MLSFGTSLVDEELQRPVVLEGDTGPWASRQAGTVKAGPRKAAPLAGGSLLVLVSEPDVRSFCKSFTISLYSNVCMALENYN